MADTPRPCPFCGHTEVCFLDVTHHGATVGRVAACVGCGATACQAHHEDIALENWNQRAGSGGEDVYVAINPAGHPAAVRATKRDAWAWMIQNMCLSESQLRADGWRTRPATLITGPIDE